jgi:hypothetical protein
VGHTSGQSPRLLTAKNIRPPVWFKKNQLAMIERSMTLDPENVPTFSEASSVSEEIKSPNQIPKVFRKVFIARHLPVDAVPQTDMKELGVVARRHLT